MWMASFNNHTRIDNQSHIDAAETTTNNQPNVVSLEFRVVDGSYYRKSHEKICQNF